MYAGRSGTVTYWPKTKASLGFPISLLACCVEFGNRSAIWEPLRVYDWITLGDSVQVLALNVLARPSNPLAFAQP